MTRSTAREIALQLGFSLAAVEEFPEDVLDRFFEKEHYESLAQESELFSEYPNKKQMEYIRTLVKLIFDHRIQLDAYIEKYSHGWKVNRISKIALAIMRCAICEILYMEDVPNKAALNEAVELAKGYEDAEAVAFINGVLGGFMRGELGEETATEEEAPVEEAVEE